MDAATPGIEKTGSPIEQVLEAVSRKKELFGLLINPWGQEFFLTRAMIRRLLDPDEGTKRGSN